MRGKRDSLSITIGIIVSLVIIAVAIFLAISFFADDKNVAEGQLSPKTIAKVVNGISAHIELPAEEEPIVGEIEDAETLIEQQSFYSGASDGDYLIIYPEAQKAILYSLQHDIIINVGPIIFDETVNVAGENITMIATEIRNGGQTAGAAGSLSEQLSTEVFEVVAVGNAAKSDYEQTIIIPLNEDLEADFLDNLAEQLNATVAAELPLAESETEADLLIIIGGE